jgi:signal transduction histidine kinase
MKTNKEDMLAQISASMKSNEDLLARMEVKIDAKQTKTDDNQEKMAVNLKEMREEIKFGQAEMRSTISAFRSELEEIIEQETKDFLSYVDQKTQILTETIEKAQVELQIVEVFLDKRTRDVE